MAHPHVSHEEFFTKLASLLESQQQKGHGSVYLTQKRLSYESDSSSTNTAPKVADDPLWDTHPPHPLPVIVRATDGKTQSAARKKNSHKIKLSTVVQPDDMDAFYARYADVCKAGMQALKKRDRSKRKKAKGGKKKAVEDKK